MDFLTVTVMREAGFEAFDNIARCGKNLAPVSFAACVAERYGLCRMTPMCRPKSPKAYGPPTPGSEGEMTEGQRFAVEDRQRRRASKDSICFDAIVIRCDRVRIPGRSSFTTVFSPANPKRPWANHGRLLLH